MLKSLFKKRFGIKYYILGVGLGIGFISIVFGIVILPFLNKEDDDELSYNQINSVDLTPKNLGAEFGENSISEYEIVLAKYEGEIVYENIYGTLASPNNDGTANFIKARLRYEGTDNPQNVKCALYNASDDSLVAETSANTITNDEYAWYQFDFSSPPNIYSSVDYYIVAYADIEESPPGDYTIYICDTGGGYGCYQTDVNDYPDFPNPASFVGGTAVCIYCDYTVGALVFSETVLYPLDESTDIVLFTEGVTCSVNISHILGSSMDGSWWSNATNPEMDSGWNCYGGFTNVYNTNVSWQYPVFNTPDTIFYWSLNLTDGSNWYNQTYSFTSGNFTDYDYMTPSSVDDASNWFDENNTHDYNLSTFAYIDHPDTYIYFNLSYYYNCSGIRLIATKLLDSIDSVPDIDVDLFYEDTKSFVNIFSGEILNNYWVDINNTVGFQNISGCRIKINNAGSNPSEYGLIYEVDFNFNYSVITYNEDPNYDPTSRGIFGYQGTGTQSANIESYIRSGYFQMTSATGAYADYMNVYLQPSSVYNGKAKCIIYNINNQTVGVSSTKIIPPGSATGVYTFYFPTKPSLTANAWYHLCVLGQSDSNSSATIYVRYNLVGGTGMYYRSYGWTVTDPEPPNPYNPTLWSIVYIMSGYCSYIQPGSAPSNPTGVIPVNNAVDVMPSNKGVFCSFNLSEPEGQTMYIYTYTNASTGVWHRIWSVISMSNGTRFTQFLEFNQPNTVYWWSVNITDGYWWVNNTYKLTTGSYGYYQYNSPDSFWDASNVWTNEMNCFDGNSSTFAYSGNANGYLYLNKSYYFDCDKVGIVAADTQSFAEQNPSVAVDMYYNGVWNNIFNGTIQYSRFTEINNSAGNKSINSIRFKINNAGSSSGDWGECFEFLFGDSTHKFGCIDNLAGQSQASITDYVRGLRDTPISNGIADNITVQLVGWDVGEEVKCALYVYGDGTDSTFLAETEEKTTGCGTDQYTVFNFSEPKPTITAGTYYGIVVFADDAINIRYATGIYTYIYEADTYPTWETPINWDSKLERFAVSIFCSYTESTGVTWHLVDNTINGVWGNNTIWRLIDNTINGIWQNTSRFYLVDDSINGIWTNATIPVWYLVDNSINGVWTNSTFFRLMDNNINGVWSNITTWRLIDNTINGVWSNTTMYRLVDNTINGVWSNASIPIWYLVDDSINGIWTNVTTFRLIDNSINGIWTNTTFYHLLDNNINGIWQNTTTYHLIDNSINGIWTNVSEPEWTLIDNSINGVWSNTTIFRLIDNSINGIWINDTETWQLLDNTINGVWTNITFVYINITNIYPSNSSTSIPLQPTLYLTVNSSFGNLLNLSFYYGPSIDSTPFLLDSFVNQTNNTFNIMDYNASSRVTNYFWRIMVNDGVNWVNYSYSFKTEGITNSFSPSNGIALLSVFSILGIIAFIRMRRRKKEDE